MNSLPAQSLFFDKPFALLIAFFLAAIATTAKTEGQSTPTNISGLQLWLAADSGITFTNNSISTWADLSGSNHSATQTNSSYGPTLSGTAQVSGTTILNGKPVVHFNGNQFFNVPDFLSSGTSAEVFIILRATGGGTNISGFWSFGTCADGSGDFYTYYDSTHTWDGVLDGFGSTTRHLEGFPSQDASQFHIYEASTQSGLWQSWMDGAMIYKTSANTVQFTHTPILGENKGGLGFIGDIAEVLIYNRPLSDSERKSIRAYLNQKYLLIGLPVAPNGLNAVQLNSTENLISWNWQQTGSQVDFIVERSTASGGTFDQIATVDGEGSYLDSSAVSGQQYYYRVYARNAAGTSGYSSVVAVANPNSNGGIVPVNGIRLWLMGDGVWESPLELWHDYSGYGNDAVQTVAGSRPVISGSTQLNGKPVVNFNRSLQQYFSLPDFLSSGTAGEIVAVLRASGTTNVSGFWRFGTCLDGDGDFYTYTDSSHTWDGILDGFGSTSRHTEGFPTQNVTSFHIYQSTSQSGLWQSWVDGITNFKTSSNTVQFSNAPLLGMNKGVETFTGDLAEVIIYNRSLSDAERKAVRAYLTQKYALASAPAAPNGLAATKLSSTANLVTWQPQSNISQIDYVLERGTSSSGPFSQIAAINGFCYLDSSVAPGQQYYYRAFAQSAGGASAYTPVVATTNSMPNGDSIPVNGMRLWLIGDGLWQSPIATWQDYSGYGNNASQTLPGAQPTISGTTLLNGRQVVNFNSSSQQYLNLPDFLSSGTAGEVLAVLRSSGTSNISGLWRLGTCTDGDGDFYTYTDSSHAWDGILDGFGSTTRHLEGFPSQDVTHFHVYEAASQNGLWQSWIDGATTCKTTTNTVQFSNAPLLGMNKGGKPFSGDIAELIIYNRPLSADERQALLIYFSTRYGLGVSTLSAPTISPSGGNYSASQTVSITSGSGSTIYYTVDGSTPTQASQPYTGPITISSSTQIKARAFKEGYLGSDIATASFGFLSLAHIADTTVDELTNTTITASATGASSSGVSYSFVGSAPSGASLSGSTGVLTWTPTEAQGPGTYPISIQAMDKGFPTASATTSFSITVNEVNSAPTLAPIQDQTLASGSSLNLTAVANDSDLPAQTLAYSLGSTPPTGATINPATGAFQWACPSTGVTGAIPVTIVVTDNGIPALSSSTSFLIHVNTAPTLTHIQDQLATPGQSVDLNAVGSDSDLPAQSLTYSLGGTAPSSATIDSTTGAFHWTCPTSGVSGTIPVTIIITDNGSPVLSGSTSFSIFVNSAPVLDAISDVVVAPGKTLTVTARATDRDLPAQTLTYSFGAAHPTGATLDSSSGAFSWNCPSDPTGSFPVTLVVTDNGTPALSGSTSFAIRVNQGPVLSSPTYGTTALNSSGTTTLSQPGTLQVTGSDQDGVDRVEFYCDGTSLIGTAPGGGGTSYSVPWDIITVASGIHALTIKGFDRLGMASKLDNLMVDVEPGPPAAPVIDPGQEGPYNKTQIILKGAAEKNAAIQFTVSGTALPISGAVGGDGRFALPITLASGTNTVSAQAVRVSLSGTQVSPSSAPVQIAVDLNIPAAPSGLTADALAGGEINLSWIPPQTGAISGYHVYRSTVHITGSDNLTPIATVSTQAYRETPLGSGSTPIDTPCYYRVSALNTLGTESALSNEAVIQRDAIPPRALSITYCLSGTSAPVSVLTENKPYFVTVEMSEKLLTTPFFGIAPSSGPTVNIQLTPSLSGSSYLYTGIMSITPAQSSGTATAILSAKDLAGNIGTAIDSGKTILFNTAGPKVVELSPLVTAVQTGTTSAVTYTATFDEPLQTAAGGTTVPPVFTLATGNSAPIAPTSCAPTADPLKWVVQFPAFQQSGTATLNFTANDNYGHVGNVIVPNHQFIIYSGSLPPLSAPTMQTAVSGSNGTIRLTWQATTNSDSTNLYRSSDGTNWVLASGSAGSPFIDNPKAGANYVSGGSYRYSATSIRKEMNASGQIVTAESAPSNVLVAISDDQAPVAPAAPTLQLQGAGVLITGTTQTDAASYRVYRSGQGNTAGGLVASDLLAPQTTDPTPDPTQPYYYFTAVDAAGNESGPSPAASYNTSTPLPVQNLTVEQIDNSAPLVTWQKPAGSVTGFDLYIGAGDGTKANPELLQPNGMGQVSYLDTNWTGDEQTYSALSIRDNSGTRYQSPRLSVTLPKVVLTSASSNTLVRGLINALHFTVTNQSSDPISHAKVAVFVTGTGALASGTTLTSADFSLAASGTSAATSEVIVKVPGYEELPFGSESAYVSLQMAASVSTKAIVGRITSFPVSEGGLSADIMGTNLTKGATASVRFKLTNPGTEKVEIVTAFNGDDSNEVRFVLLDPNGNVLAKVPFQQIAQNEGLSGGTLINTPGGTTILRLNGGETFTSAAVDLPIPASAPEQVFIALQVDNVYSDYSAGASAPILNGLDTKRSFSLVTTPYRAVVSSVTPNSATKQCVISGSAIYNGGNPVAAPNAAIALIVEINGFERSYPLTTDAQGNFTYTFKPGEHESGGTYSVWATHPDVNDHTPQATFSLGRVFTDYDQYGAQALRNHLTQTTVNISNGSSSTEANVHLVYLGQSATSTGDTLPSWITVGGPLASLAGGSNGSINLQYQPDSTVATGSSAYFFQLTSTGTDGVTHNWQTFEIDCQVADAAPVLSLPSYLSTGAQQAYGNPNSSKPTMESIVVSNIGTAPMENVKVSLVNPNGTQAPAWISIVSATDLGSIDANSSQTVQLSISPDASVPVTGSDMPQQFTLRVQADNIPAEGDVPISVIITSGSTPATGKALLHVFDLFMGAPAPVPNPSFYGVPNAQVSFESETTGQTVGTLTTGSDGQVQTDSLPVGSYRLRVTAPKHDTYQGQIWIKPGITVSQEVQLDYQTVSIQWEVVPTTIIDHYTISLQATYDTNVPAPVVTAYPATLQVPDLCPGDTYTGQIVFTNLGSIEATQFQFNAPPNDQYFTYELLDGIPSIIKPGEQVIVSYKVRCVQALPGSSCFQTTMSTSGPGDARNLASATRFKGIGSSSVIPWVGSPEDAEHDLSSLIPIGILNDCFSISICWPWSFCWQCPWNQALKYNASGSSCAYYSFGKCGGGGPSTSYTPPVSRKSGAPSTNHKNGWMRSGVPGGANTKPVGGAFGGNASCVPPPCTPPDLESCPPCDANHGTGGAPGPRGIGGPGGPGGPGTGGPGTGGPGTGGPGTGGPGNDGSGKPPLLY